jgi:hypothetical protein
MKPKLSTPSDDAPDSLKKPLEKPVIPPIFKRPPMKNSFSQGSKIRQDGKNRFFSRTRRGI